MLVVVVMDALAKGDSLELIGCKIDVGLQQEASLNFNFPFAQRNFLSVAKPFVTAVQPNRSSDSVLTLYSSEKGGHKLHGFKLYISKSILRGSRGSR